MINEALFYTLWGLMVALIVQALYDLIGDYLNAKKKPYFLKFCAGMFLVAVLGIIISLAMR